MPCYKVGAFHSADFAKEQMFFPSVEKVPLIDSPKTNFLFLPMKCQSPCFSILGGLGVSLPPVKNVFIAPTHQICITPPTP